MMGPNSSGRCGRVRSARADTKGHRRVRGLLALLLGGVFLLVTAAAALALGVLPPGGQVNDDLAAGINKTISVSGEEPTNADVVGGALTAGAPAVPWAIFRQQETNSAPPPNDQVFSRSFAGGEVDHARQRHSRGTFEREPDVQGIAQLQPGARRRGAGDRFRGREPHRAVGDLVRDSRRDPGSATTTSSPAGLTTPAMPTRVSGSSPARTVASAVAPVPVPSLNIHTSANAQNPSVAGGSATDPTKPGPWVTWQETTTLPVNKKDQIFVVRPIGPGSTNCDGVKPAGVLVGGHVPAIGGFCWQQTGIPRVGAASADPSLNVDPTRDGVEPDIAFTGPSDGVPWVVWYETGATGISGLHSNYLVFAAKGVSDGVAANGRLPLGCGGEPVAAGPSTRAARTASATCAASATNEAQCSLNHSSSANAEDPQVAAGTMNPPNPTVPWVVWDETVAGVNQVFVSRLVGSGSSAHFQIVNGGAPISNGAGALYASRTSRSRGTHRTCRGGRRRRSESTRGSSATSSTPPIRRSSSTRRTWH